MSQQEQTEQQEILDFAYGLAEKVSHRVPRSQSQSPCRLDVRFTQLCCEV